GAAASIDYRAQDIAAALRAWAPGGVDLVLDAVGGDTLPDALDLLAPGGTLVTIMTLAAGDAERLAATAAEAARRGLRTAMTYSRMPSGGTLARIAEQLDKRALRVPRFDHFPLEQAARALDLVQTGEARTKLVLHVADIAR
ncbi:TPA: zinc-binding dehydrogenase, partial [Burkholderia aenigmatica]|nr:zinc-binding dehydrogenase [Burkholderia aenigmatica]